MSQSRKPTASATGVDFIRARITEDLERGAVKHVGTRFPPEPNGYLHIGHAKSICLNFGIASEFGGACNLRFDDTNPLKESREYEDAIREDVRWLGFDWDDRLHHASDYFDRLHELAVLLIRKGRAYVDSLSAEEIRAHRGTLTEPGRDSPYRDRSVDENLELFRAMSAGEHPDGAHVLRAKIDMASPNLNMRDPTLYRVRNVVHHRTGDRWHVYPMYDFTHCLSDSFEGITHSLCTLEFEDNRPLYDWVLEATEVENRPRQIEFAPLVLNYTIVSKRKLRRLVEEKLVDGWDDPRMPTLRGMRRRGYTPEAIRDFCHRIGVSKRDSRVDMAQLEFSLRDDLNRRARRFLAVLRPLKVVIENWPAGFVDEVDAVNNPEDEAAGTRKIPFSGELFIEQDDFREEPPPKYYRLSPGREVRLRYGYYVRCTGVVKDPETGEIVEVRCTYDPESRGGSTPDGRKVKSTIHWVSADHAATLEVRLYDRLFAVENPGALDDFVDGLNPDSLEVLREAKGEPALLEASKDEPVQFERTGYFCLDRDSTADTPVFNRTVTLRDSWARMQKAKG